MLSERNHRDERLAAVVSAHVASLYAANEMTRCQRRKLHNWTTLKQSFDALEAGTVSIWPVYFRLGCSIPAHCDIATTRMDNGGRYVL